jgi:superfamily II DNA/RNA helicase
MKCEDGKKLDFIKTIFDVTKTTQTFIFVNTKDFAVKVHERLRKAGFKSFLFFSWMTKEERDETIEKFRRIEVNILITINMFTRGFPLRQTDIVINFDVP